MTGENDDELHDELRSSQPEQPWHNSTPALLGATVAGLATIAVLIALVTFMTGQFDKPQEAPLNFVEPTRSATATSSSGSTPTTTETITSTSPPVTTDINPASETPSSNTSSTSPSSTSPSSTSPSSNAEQPSTSRASGSESSAPSTTRRPRYNETRTLYPLPRN